MTEFNKLVRDGVPAIIEANGETSHYHIIADDTEYLQALFQKDAEEGQELIENPSLEELADKLEVLHAIATALGYTFQQVEQARIEKAEKRGGFNNRIFLESTE